MLSLFFFQNNFSKKYLLGIPECKTVGIQIRSNILSGLIGSKLSDFIWDFGKLPFLYYLGNYIIKIEKVSTKIHEIGKIKAILDWK